MSEIFFSIGVYAVLFWFGLTVVNTIKMPKIQIAEKIGISFAVGSSFYVTVMLLLFFLNIPWYVHVIITLMAIAGILKIRKVTFRFPKLPRLNRIQSALCILITLALLVPFVYTFFNPLTSWDGIASWFAGAKGLVVNRTISPSFYTLMNFDFPPAAHLLIALPGFILGSFSEAGGLLLFDFINASTVFLFFGMLRSRSSLTASLFFTFLLVSTQNYIRHAGYYDVGHVDILLSYFLLVGIFFLQKIRYATAGFLFVFGLILMLISLTKNESIFFASFLFILSCFSLMKEKKFTYIIGFVPGGSLVLLWFIFRFFNLPPPPYYIIGNGNIGSTLQISLAMVRELANLQRWNLAWIFIIAALVYPKIKKSLRLVLLVCVFQLVAFVFAYFASPLNPVDHVNTSFDRLLLQLYPCFFYLASVNFMSIHQPRSRLQ